MNNIKNNTILGQDLFEYTFKKSLIMHIPHASVFIPNKQDYIINETELNKELLKLTDIGTDIIFNMGDDVTHVNFNYNRLYCDVERLPDNQEEMYKVGRGFYYTKTDDGYHLRCNNDKQIVKEIYDKYHEDFNNLVEEKLKTNGVANIIDCHSFSDVPFNTDINQEGDRPDI